jgi:curved DNA-binding protein CbpA
MPHRPIGERGDALRLLGLRDPVDRAEVVSAYRRLVPQHHPDLGGDPDAFRSLTVARDVLLADARTDPGENARTPAGRSVTARQRRRRRLLRRLRRRLSRNTRERRHLD